MRLCTIKIYQKKQYQLIELKHVKTYSERLEKIDKKDTSIIYYIFKQKIAALADPRDKNFLLKDQPQHA